MPKLIVIDTAARTMAGLDENNAADVGKLIQALDRLVRELDCAVLVIHHSGKDETILPVTVIQSGMTNMVGIALSRLMSGPMPFGGYPAQVSGMAPMA